MPITTIFNTFDGNAAGSYSVASSGYQAGTKFDSYQMGTGATISWDTTKVAHGSTSVRCQTTSAGVNSYLQWSPGQVDISTTRNVYDRLYFQVSAVPTTDVWIHAVGGEVATCYFKIAANTGQLYMDVGGIKAYGNVYVAANTWYRLESVHYYNASGYAQAKVFSGANLDSETGPDDYWSTGNFNYNNTTGANSFHYAGIGGLSSPAGTYQVWIDEWRVSNDYNWIGPWKPYDTVKTNNFEDGVPGNSVSYMAGAGNTAITTINLPAGNTIVYDNAQAMHGSRSVKLSTTTSGGNFGWSGLPGNLAGNTPTLWSRFYIYVPALPTASAAIQYFDLWGTTGQALYLDTAGKFYLYMASASATMCTTTTGIATNTWYRVEVRGQARTTAGNNAGGEIRVYQGDSLTLYTSAVSGNSYSSTAIGGYNGVLQGVHQNIAAGYWVDDFALSTTTWVGPSATVKNASDTGALAQSESVAITSPSVPVNDSDSFLFKDTVQPVSVTASNSDSFLFTETLQPLSVIVSPGTDTYVFTDNILNLDIGVASDDLFAFTETELPIIVTGTLQVSGSDSGQLTESGSIAQTLFIGSGDTGKLREQYIPPVPSQVTWKTEIAFTTVPTALISAQMWTDVSGYVLESAGTSVKYGRSDELSEISPATLSLTLDNSDGRFTPGNSGSPYSPNIDMGKLIRRTAIVDGQSYIRFTGYIDSLAIPEWTNSQFFKAVTVEASDRLARIGAAKTGVMLSVHDYETLKTSPQLYFPLRESANSNQVASIATSYANPLLRVENAGDTRMGNGESLYADDIPLPYFESVVSETPYLVAASDYFDGQLASPLQYSSSYAVSVACWAFVEADHPLWTQGVNSILPTVVQLTGSFTGMSLGTNSLGNWSANIGGTQATGARPGAGWHHFVAVAQPGQPIITYVNNVQYIGPTAPAATATLDRLQIGVAWLGTLGPVTVWQGSVSAAQVDALYRAGTDGLEGMLTSDAMTTVAGYAGIPAPEIVCGRGQSRIGFLPTTGRSAAEIMKAIAKVEGGIVFADRAGTMQFHTRSRRWGRETIDMTVHRDEIKSTLGVAYDDSHLVNEATISQTNGGFARAVDTTSQNARGIYAQDLGEMAFWTEAECSPRARSTVRAYKVPLPRMGSLPVHITTSPVQKHLLGLEIGSLIQVYGLSPGAPNFGLQWIEGFDETQSIDDYSIVIITSPMLPTENKYYLMAGMHDYKSRCGGYAVVAP